MRRARGRARGRRRPRGSSPWRRSAARCARRRPRGTAARSRIGSTTKLRIARDALLRTGPSLEPQPASAGEPRVQLLPDALVRPVGDILVRGALQVEPGDLRRAHGEQGEAALVAGVDQLLRGGRRLGEDAEPRERVGPLVHVQRALRDARPAHAVEAVAPAMKSQRDLAAPRLRPGSGSRGASPSRSCDAHVLDLERILPPRREPGGDQVLHDLVLAVDGDRARRSARQSRCDGRCPPNRSSMP